MSIQRAGATRWRGPPRWDVGNVGTMRADALADAGDVRYGV